jgi:putative transposase
MRCSMSRKGNCWDNAPMESFFGSLKTELDGDGPFDTRQVARTALFRFVEPSGSPDIEPSGSPDIEPSGSPDIEPSGSPDIKGWHNRQRLRSSLGYTTPANKEQLAAAA